MDIHQNRKREDVVMMVGVQEEYKEVSLKSVSERELYEDDEEEPKIYSPHKRSICSRAGKMCKDYLQSGINLHKTEQVPENERYGCREGWDPVYEIVFESSTMKGQLFDLVLIIMITISVTTACLDSVRSIRDQYGSILLVLEFMFTVIFTIEYILRVSALKRPSDYMCSTMGLMDAVSIVPTYVGTFISAARPLVHLAVLRVLRVLRVFRVLKLVRFVDEAVSLTNSIHENKRRITVFLFAVFTIILVIGCAMYLIEGEIHGFSSIPVSLYWTVVTLTTVGYGDIAPQTVFGRCLATLVMLSGYGIIACPLVLHVQGLDSDSSTNVPCPRCGRKNHQPDAVFCRLCGTPLAAPRQFIKERRRKTNHVRSPPSTRKGNQIEEQNLLEVADDSS